MNVTKRMLLLLSAVVVVTIGLAPSSAYADHKHGKRGFSGVYVFGDSLSDPGNAFAVVGEFSKPPWQPIPELPYKSRRMSNGKTWAELVARKIGDKRGALPAYKDPRFGNFAFAGARLRGTGAEKPSFGDQVTRYLEANAGVADPKALYVVQFGGNDIRDALVAAQLGQDPVAVIGEAIQALAYNVTVLSHSGARRFLIANAPNIGKVPVIAALGAQIPAEQLSAAYNLALDGVLAQLAASGLEIYRLDFFSFLDAATDMPQGLGFVDAANPCLQVFEAPATGVCEDPDQHLFWDGLHPTRAGHRLVAVIAINTLSID